MSEQTQNRHVLDRHHQLPYSQADLVHEAKNWLATQKSSQARTRRLEQLKQETEKSAFALCVLMMFIPLLLTLCGTVVRFVSESVGSMMVLGGTVGGMTCLMATGLFVAFYSRKIKKRISKSAHLCTTLPSLDDVEQAILAEQWDHPAVKRLWRLWKDPNIHRQLTTEEITALDKRLQSAPVSVRTQWAEILTNPNPLRHAQALWMEQEWSKVNEKMHTALANDASEQYAHRLRLAGQCTTGQDISSVLCSDSPVLDALKSTAPIQHNIGMTGASEA